MRLIVGTLLLGTLLGAHPANVQAQSLPVDNNVMVNVELLQGSGGVYAVTTVTSRYHLPTWGYVNLEVNGRIVKVEPISTSDRQVNASLVSPGGTQSLSCCGTFSGRFSVGGDSSRGAQVLDCAYRAGAPGFAPPVAGRSTALAGRLPSMGFVGAR